MPLYSVRSTLPALMPMLLLFFYWNVLPLLRFACLFFPCDAAGIVTFFMGLLSLPSFAPFTLLPLSSTNFVNASSGLLLLRAFYAPECALLLPSVHTKGGLSLACGLLATFEAVALAFLPLLSHLDLTYVSSRS